MQSRKSSLKAAVGISNPQKPEDFELPEKWSKKLQNWHELAFDGFLKELKKKKVKLIPILVPNGYITIVIEALGC